MQYLLFINCSGFSIHLEISVMPVITLHWCIRVVDVRVPRFPSNFLPQLLNICIVLCQLVFELRYILFHRTIIMWSVKIKRWGYKLADPLHMGIFLGPSPKLLQANHFFYLNLKILFLHSIQPSSRYYSMTPFIKC